MARNKSRKASPPGATVTGALALLLLVCLAECATASCLNYGHSCWGAHGKRSAELHASEPDWFIRNLIRSVDHNNNMERIQRAADGSSGIYLGNESNERINSPSAGRMGSDNIDYPWPLDGQFSNAMPLTKSAKPMLDDDRVSRMRLLRIMRDTSSDLE